MNFNETTVETGHVATYKSRLEERITLFKRGVIAGEGEKRKYEASIFRTFYDVNDPEEPIAELSYSTTCDNCYLQEMSDGCCLPVVENGQREIQYFGTWGKDGSVTYWGSTSYHKARKLAERQLTFLGRLRNRIAFSFMNFPF